MDEQLDNDLKYRIKEVFDNYEDTAANEGWLLLRERFPERKRRTPVWLWWGSVAALLLVFIGMGIWLLTPKIKPDQLTYKNTKLQPAIKLHLKDTTGETSVAAVQGNEKHAPASHLAAGSVGSAGRSGGDKKNPVIVVAARKTIEIKNLPQHHLSGNNSKPTPDEFQGYAANKADVSAPARQLTAAHDKKWDSLNTPAADSPLANVVAKSPPKSTIRLDTAVTANAVAQRTTSKRSIEDMFKNEPINKIKQPVEKAAADKKVRFSVYAATYFNYAKGSTNQLNAGAGFSSDIKLSEKFKLSTGIAIAQNSLNYANSTPSATAGQAFLATALRDASYTASTVYSALPPTLKNYNARLMALDIPLNIKYELNPQKNDTYISAGFSSGTFINETYTYNYNYPAFFSPAQQPQNASTNKSFDSFYLVKTLNLSFGLGYPLGKTNRLVIEPFLKYPLDGLGSQQLRFGAGGINLKLNFKPTKK